MMDKVMYCEKCGHVGHIVFNKKCKNCGTKMKFLFYICYTLKNTKMKVGKCYGINYLS